MGATESQSRLPEAGPAFGPRYNGNPNGVDPNAYPAYLLDESYWKDINESLTAGYNNGLKQPPQLFPDWVWIAIIGVGGIITVNLVRK